MCVVQSGAAVPVRWRPELRVALARAAHTQLQLQLHRLPRSVHSETSQAFGFFSNNFLYILTFSSSCFPGFTKLTKVPRFEPQQDSGLCRIPKGCESFFKPLSPAVTCFSPLPHHILLFPISQPLSELEYLNLGYNCLQRAPLLGLSAKAKLVTLNLRNNELETINGGVD